MHNSSIFSAVAETGLQLYKFGKTATIPFSGKLENMKNILKENKKVGAHTLLLLDLDAEAGLYMSAADAVKILLKEKILKPSDKIVAAGALGTENSEIVFAPAKTLLEKEISTPAVLVVSGKLHFREKDFLEMEQAKLANFAKSGGYKLQVKPAKTKNSPSAYGSCV